MKTGERRLAERRSEPSASHMELAVASTVRDSRTGKILHWFGDAADSFS